MSSEQTPLVSIAMCTYNGEQFIREQLDSLIAQDYQNLEIIIVDDCSTDSTYAILTTYAPAHESIELYSNSKNLGFKRNFERALKLCNGSFIALCDQDDIWFSNKITTLVNEIKSNMLIFSNSSIIDKYGETLNTEFHSHIRIDPPHRPRWQSLVFGNYILGHTMLFQSELLKHAQPFPDEFKEHDHWLAVCAASMGSVAYLPKTLSYYRIHEHNCSTIKIKRKKKNIEAFTGYFLKKRRQALRLTSKYKIQLEQMKCILKLECIPEDEKNDLKMIEEAYRNSRHNMCLNNSPLKKLLESNPTYTSAHMDKKRFIRSICRGFLASIIR